jgi:hypothetical protein
MIGFYKNKLEILVILLLWVVGWDLIHSCLVYISNKLKVNIQLINLLIFFIIMCGCGVLYKC